MSLLGWVLLEHFVLADVAIRTTFSAGAPPLTAFALMALVLAVTVLMAHTFRALLCAVVALVVQADTPAMHSEPQPGSLSLVWSVPKGGTGPRAPGWLLRRPRSLQTAR